MKIAILTSGIMPVPAVQGGAVETLADYYLEYNNRHKLHDITVYSVYYPTVRSHPALLSNVNHYRYIDTTSQSAKVRKYLHKLIHRHTYYHYSIDYYCRRTLTDIRRHDYDLIIIENRPGFALALQGRTKARLVYHLHNDFLNSTTNDAAQIYQAASKILTVSDYIRSRVQTCAQQDTKTVTVHNGIDLSSFTTAPSLSRDDLGFEADDFVLVFSGRLIREKGILELAEAMNLLAAYPQIKLLVMGSAFYGNASSDDDFIRELKLLVSGLKKRIRFTGYVDHDTVPDYLRLSDAAVIPSTWEEPFGLTVLEGMAAGLPIITTNRGGIPEIVSMANAIVIPYPCDLAICLSNAILSLYRDKQRQQSMGEASRRLSERYAKELYARKFFESLV